MQPFVPKFKCEYCGEEKAAYVEGEAGMFVPCDSKECREKRERAHWEEIERRKQWRRRNR